jgi:hypothetical protein
VSVWESYPIDYRQNEIKTILRAIRGGACVSLVGLSGAGKSNLLGFLYHNWPLVGEDDDLRFALVDCNSLEMLNHKALFKALSSSLGFDTQADVELSELIANMARSFADDQRNLCLMFDRFDAFEDSADNFLFNNLRALRDAYKYQLTYLIATRRPLSSNNELAELFFANTLWLGALSQSDSEWNVARYASRLGSEWDKETSQTLIQLSGGYPSMLRALCEAYADLQTLQVNQLVTHPAVQLRINEFWADQPDDDILDKVGLIKHPTLMVKRTPKFNTADLTAKEHTLLTYFFNHPDIVCEKDDLIKEIWSEDAVFEQGVRDDSLAQLVRRLRKKIESDPSNPRFIHTVPGRGYRFTP